MDNKVKISLYINNLHSGGAERVLVLLANYLDDDPKYSVKIYSAGDNHCKHKINEHITVTELRCQTNLEKIRKIRKSLISDLPDYVISFESHMNMKVILANTGLNSKVVVSERTDPRKSGKNRKGYNLIRELLYERAYWLVFQTEDAQNFFNDKIKRKSSIILNPLNPLIPQPWYGDRDNRVVNFCRIDKAKNLPLLIDAFELFNKELDKKYTLDIYGNGEEKENILKYIVNNKYECVKMHDARPDIYEVVKTALMFVSSSDFEGLSNSMLEAMAMGIPTICTDCPCYGARMVIKNGQNGIIVPTNDVNSLYRAMKSIAANKELARTLGENAVDIRKIIDSSVIMKQWKSILE